MLLIDQLPILPVSHPIVEFAVLGQREIRRRHRLLLPVQECLRLTQLVHRIKHLIRAQPVVVGLMPRWTVLRLIMLMNQLIPQNRLRRRLRLLAAILLLAVLGLRPLQGRFVKYLDLVIFFRRLGEALDVQRGLHGRFQGRVEERGDELGIAEQFVRDG